MADWQFTDTEDQKKSGDWAFSDNPTPMKFDKQTLADKIRSSDIGRLLQGAVVDPLAGLAQTEAHYGKYLGPALDPFGGISDVAESLLGKNKLTDIHDQYTKGLDSLISKNEEAYQSARQKAGPGLPLGPMRSAFAPADPVTVPSDYKPGFDTTRLVGNVVSPANWIGGGMLGEVGIGKTLLSRLGQSMGVGAGFSAMQPVTDTKDMSFDAQKGVQAALGAVTGPLAQLLGEGSGWALKAAKDAVRPFSKKAGTIAASNAKAPIEEMTGKILNEMAGTDPLQMNWQNPPLPGTKYTVGQTTNNPGLLSLERTLQQRNAGGAGDVMLQEANRTASNNTAVRDAIEKIGNLGTDAPAAMSARLEAADKAAKIATRAKWKAVGIDDNTNVPIGWLKTRVTDYLGGLKVAEKKAIPPDVLATLEELPKGSSLGEIQAWRADVGDKVRAAFRAGETNKGRILGGLADTISTFLDDVPTLSAKSGMTPEKMALYNEARAATRSMKQTFNEPPDVRKALAVDSHGADRLPVSATADQFIKAGKGGPEALNSYLKAVGNDQEGLQAARDAFAQKFLKSIEGVGTDVSGNSPIIAGKTEKFLDQYGHVVNSKLFTAPQRDLLSRIQNATEIGARTMRSGPKGGSDTAAKLIGNKYLDVLIGPDAGKLLNAGSTLGGALAGHLVGGPVGALAGAFTGIGAAKVGDRFLERALYEAPREKVINLLQEAISDPQLAKALMMKTRPGQLQLLPAPVRKKILSILGQSFPIAASRTAVASAPFITNIFGNQTDNQQGAQ